MRQPWLTFIVLVSLIFYGSWNPNYLFLIIGSIIFNYFIGEKISLFSHKKFWLIIGVVGNISLLGYFKYCNFFVDSLNFLFALDIVVDRVILPLAISFFTFQQIAWLVDQYHSEAPKCSFLEYCTAVTFFPHLIAGPIVQYHDLIPQLQCETVFKFEWKNCLNALFLIACGTFKKIVIADHLAFFATLYFDKTESLGLIQAWLGLASYSAQIYFDFSGYCDIALGSALFFGITLPINFNSPYKSTSIRDFWKRWHITLGYFLSKYLYFPLGGSRKGIARTCVNLFIVMFISGFWHGAGICFIIWGMMHGFGMVLHRLFNYFGLSIRSARLSIMVTFLYISLAWVWFRSLSMDAAIRYIRALFNATFFGNGIGFANGVSLINEKVPNAWNLVLGIKKHDFNELLIYLVIAYFIIFCAPTCQVLYDKYIKGGSRKSLFFVIFAAILFVSSLYKMIMVPYSEFIYFNF